MLSEATLDPPLLLAQTVYCVVVKRSVAVPQIVPLLSSKVKPVGRFGCMAHDVMTPGPVNVGLSGRFELTVLLKSVRFSGEYETSGT